MKSQIRVFVLKALRAAQGQPLTEAALVGAVAIAFPDTPVSLIRETIKELETDAWIAAALDELTNTANYGLKRKGAVKASQL